MSEDGIGARDGSIGSTLPEDVSFQFAPSACSRVHLSVLSELGGRILGGLYRPGDILPREDQLCEMLGVSRTSLREAVKVLSAKGLVEPRRRRGASVRPRAEWRLLDAEVLSWHPDLAGDGELIASLLEARRIIEPAAAELAARRRRDEDLAAIEAAFASMREAIPDDLEGCCKADLAFHRAIVSASHNIMLTGLVGMLEAALRTSFTITNRLMRAQSRALDAHGKVLDEIRAGDTAGARLAMSRLLDIASEDLRTQ